MGVEFFWDKELPASKSELIRAYCLKSWNPEIKINGSFSGADTQNMSRALEDFLKNKNTPSYHCGDSALMLRLWATRLSRSDGEVLLNTSKRLLERPHGALWDALEKLGSSVTLSSLQVKIKSSQWKRDATHIFVDSSKSSQYLSALVLNSWNLEQDMTWDYSTLASRPYLDMTLQIAKKFGMELETELNKIHIRKNQTPKTLTHSVEPDMSTAFTIAAWATVGGKALFKNFPKTSYQPDFKFLNILNQMGVQITHSQDLEIKKTDQLKPINLDLSNAPDLFPVLSILCAFADGVSQFKNLDQLQWKESNRINQALKFIEALGRRANYDGKIFEIEGKNFNHISNSEIIFDPDHDHRWVMAAHVAKIAGFNVKILNPEAINKTAPELLHYVC